MNLKKAILPVDDDVLVAEFFGVSLFSDFWHSSFTARLSGRRFDPRKSPSLLECSWSTAKKWKIHRISCYTRIMVSKGTWHKTSTQNLRVFWRFWVLITLTSTLNPICPVLRYPCGKQFFSTEYPPNKIYFPDKKPYSGDFQYKKSNFGKKWPKIDQNCE